jgi:hypothetical protein
MRPVSESYWRFVAIECLLELAAARDALSQVDGDMVELVAHQRVRIYHLLGGRGIGLAAFRATVRHELRTGEPT